MNKKESAPKDSAKIDEDAVAEKEKVTKTPKSKNRKMYSVRFFYEWCKSCGICSALCTKSIILQDETGHPYIDNKDGCIGCRFCEIHCPDFAITVKERTPERRKTDGNS